MSSITLKISSLLIRTLSKPIAVRAVLILPIVFPLVHSTAKLTTSQSRIKLTAREHARFRRICVSFAQSLHRIDMRLRLGLLQDTASIDRIAAKEAAKEAASKASSSGSSTAASSKDPSKASSGSSSSSSSKPRIRPLSESKAIDTGANFISEAFLFLVGGAVIVNESFRSRRKENTRREDVTERLRELEEREAAARKGLVALETEVLRLRAEKKKTLTTTATTSEKGRILPREVWEVGDDDDEGGERAGGGGRKWWWPFAGGAKISEGDVEEKRTVASKREAGPAVATVKS